LAYLYAVNLLRGRFEKGENAILASQYASHYSKAFLDREDIRYKMDLCCKYLDHAFAYTQNVKVTTSGREVEPDEPFMRAIEGKIYIPEQSADDFRRCIAGSVGFLASQGKKFQWNSNPQLRVAFERYLADAKAQVKPKLEDQLTIESMAAKLCVDYIDNIFADVNGTKVSSRSSGSSGSSHTVDVLLMQSVEKHMGLKNTNVNDYRRMIAGLVGKLAAEGKKFTWESNAQLKSAFLKVIEQAEAPKTKQTIWYAE
jgi:predicted Ser/Thr protein kinase